MDMRFHVKFMDSIKKNRASHYNAGFNEYLKPVAVKLFPVCSVLK